MTTRSLIELAVAALLAGLAIWLYRRPQGQDPAPDSYGSQGAVLLLAVAAIIAVHVVMTERAHPHSVTVEVDANDA